MNKRISTILLTLMIIASCILSSACTVISKKETKKKRHVPRSQRDRDDDDEDDDDDDDDDETKPSRKKTDRIEVPNYLNGQSTWFDNQGLEFTPNGPFQMEVYSYGQFTTVPATIMIETNYDADPGYKNIVATTNIQMTMGDYHFWTSSFDKYTGTSFEFHGDANSIYNGCDILREGDVPLTIGDYDYVMHIAEHIEMTDDITTITYTIRCPLEYDGTVLQYGATGDTSEDYRDFSTSWLASDFTDMHGHFNYFTLQGLYIDAK